MQNQSINSPDCVNLSIHGLDYRPHMKGFIFDVMKEIWKDVDDYESYYQVSNLGRVESLDRTIWVRLGHWRNQKGRILKQYQGVRGYYTVNLCKKSKYKLKTTHRIVAIAFIPNPENKYAINHKDGNKLNNYISNLEWVTKSENELHAHKIGLKKGAWLGKFGKDHIRSKPILQFDKQGSFIAEFAATSDAMRQTGIHHTNILSACHGKYKSSGGYIWKFK